MSIKLCIDYATHQSSIEGLKDEPVWKKYPVAFDDVQSSLRTWDLAIKLGGITPRDLDLYNEWKSLTIKDVCVYSGKFFEENKAPDEIEFTSTIRRKLGNFDDALRQVFLSKTKNQEEQLRIREQFKTLSNEIDKVRQVWDRAPFPKRESWSPDLSKELLALQPPVKRSLAVNSLTGFNNAGLNGTELNSLQKNRGFPSSSETKKTDPKFWSAVAEERLDNGSASLTGNVKYISEIAVAEEYLDNGSAWLTGNVKYIPVRVSEKLKENLKIAKDLIRYTQGIIKESRNFPNRSEKFREMNLEEKTQHYDKLNKKRASKCQTKVVNNDLFAGRITSCTNNDWEDSLQKVGVGNCEEMAFIGWKYAEREKLPISVEFFYLEGSSADHAFLVFDRDKTFEDGDYKNWGPNALIVDPWAGAYYPAEELESRLKDYVGCFDFNTHITGFHPSLHSLERGKFVDRKKVTISDLSFAEGTSNPF